MTMNEPTAASGLSTLTSLKERYYRFPRSHVLKDAFDDVLRQFIAAKIAGQHFEGRGLILTGESRAGKSHEMKQLLQAFAAEIDPLAAGVERKYVRASLRTTVSWKHLGSALLKQLRYPVDLDHRSSDLIWSRVESQLIKQKCPIVQIDEGQHLLADKRPAEQNLILNGLKDLMKRPDWPVMLILTGVPELIEHVNKNEQLAMLLQPVRFEPIAGSEADMKEVDAMLCQFASVVDLDPSAVRTEDLYNRLIHAGASQWGRVIELVILTLTDVVEAGRKDLRILDFANRFAVLTGVPREANVFLISNPYRVATKELYRG